MTDRVDHCICKQMHGCQGNPLSGWEERVEVSSV